MARTPYFPNNISLESMQMPELLNNPQMLESMQYTAPKTGYRVYTPNKHIPKSKSGGANLPTEYTPASNVGPVLAMVGDTVVDDMMDGGAKGGLKGMFGNLSNTAKNAWGNVKAGKGIMPKYAGLAKGAAGAMAGLKAIQGVSDYQSAKENTDDLVNDILASAAGNSMYRHDLSADQLATLRKLQNGSYDTTGDFDMDSLLGNLGNIATGAGVGFVTGGGPVGAILGGLSGVVDGVSSGMVGNQEQITADLQSLYDALYESEMRNKQMKRDAAYQHYANSLY